MTRKPFSKNTLMQAVSATAFAAILCVAMPLTATTANAAQADSQAGGEKAQSSERSERKSRVRRAQTMRPQIFKKLDKARELADNKQYDDALEALNAMEKVRRNSYETAMTWNMFAYVHFNREDFSAATSAYQEVLKVKNLPESLEQTTLYSLAKLYLVQENYQDALVMLNQWFDVVEKPGADAFVLRAQIQYQLENFAKALPDVKKAIALVKEQGNQPRENWLLIERAVYYQNKDFAAMERCLKDLIALYPKPQYWVQLSAVYNELGKAGEELAAMETAYEQKLLTKEAQVVSLAQAFLSQEVPYKAAKVLLQGIKDGVVEESGKNLSLLGDALMIAKEYDHAIKVMAQAAQKTQAGKDFYKLAQIHTERQEWDQALANVTKALADEKLKEANSARILKGLVLFNQNNLSLAKAEFEKAKTVPETQKMAEQWLSYIEGEEKRRAYMAQG